MAEERSEEQIIAQQVKMCDWLRSHKMYSEWDSAQVMRAKQAIFDKLEPALSMLEHVIWDFEYLSDQLQPEEYAEYRAIVEATNKLRKGEQ